MQIILEGLNFDSGANQPMESFCYIYILCEAGVQLPPFDPCY